MSKTKLYILIFMLVFVGFFSKAPMIHAATTSYKGYSAKLVDKSYAGSIRARTDSDLTVELYFENTGTKTWYNNSDAFVTMDVSDPYLRESAFWHRWWKTWDSPAWLLESKVEPGETGTFRFAIHMPKEPGEYTENFRLAATNEAWIPGGKIEIQFSAIDSTYSGPVVTKAEETKETINSSTEEEIETEEDVAKDPRFNPTSYEIKTIDEFKKISLPSNLIADDADDPTVRIGLYSTEQEVVISSAAIFEILDKNDKRIAKVFDSEKIETVFNTKTKITKIFDESKKVILTTDEPIRFISTDEDVPLEILTNKTNTNTWTNYTLFKGVLELRYTDDDTFWIINELSMGDYLKGSAECGNNNPAAYLEAMAIAERSYAMQRLLNNGKHAERNFDLVSHTGDQVYRGYSRELTQPNVVKAVEDTKGLVITHGGAIVITPYFAHSNGWTRSWTDAWGGTDKPWLQPVYVPVDDDGNGRFGHGVGMSAIGAKDMADNEYNFEEILNWFYTDIVLLKSY